MKLGKKTLEVPILQGGMGVGVSLSGLAGHVAKCGALGCISSVNAGYREPDFENNPLEAGIEIIAQPPGKKLQNINLMSGGEKTMFLSTASPGITPKPVTG